MERLTEYIKDNIYTAKQCEECKESIEKCGECFLFNSVKNKLGRLEDIMEKYGIESVEELDRRIADGKTWQKACELACEREDDCYVYDNIHRA